MKRSHTVNIRSGLVLAFILVLTVRLWGQTLPRCSQRPLVVELPRVNSLLWCLERPLDEGHAGELAFTAIAFGPDDTLYATRPLTGELYALLDTDGDGLPDKPQPVADGLALPNGLAADADALYIMGDGHVYRLAAGSIETLVDDLPGGRGFMASAIAAHGERLYLGLPMPCDFCEEDAPLRGTVISMALDGSDRQIVARGLRYPAGLAFYDGALWVTDTARDGLRDSPMLDELNRIDLDAPTAPHFGFPYCVGMNNAPDWPGDFDCADAVAPAIALPTHSTPLALLPYTGETFPFLTGDLVFVLGGKLSNDPIRGYQVAYLKQLEGGTVIESIIPFDAAIAPADRLTYNPQTGYISLSSELLNRRGAGVWPHRPFAVAQSPEGWLFISVGGGTIYVLRPGDRDPCEFRPCQP